MARVAISGDYYGLGAGVDAYGSEANSQYIDKKFAKKVLLQYYNESTAVQMCNTDYEGEIKGSGDSVVVRKDPTINIGDYTVGATITYQVPEEDAQTMYIDQAKYAAFKIDTIDDLQSDIGLPNRFQNAAANDMKQVIDKEVFDYMVAGAAGATSPAGSLVATNNKGIAAGEVSLDINLGAFDAELTISATNIHEYLVNLGTVLSEARITDMGRWACMNPAVAAFLQTSDLKRADITNDTKGAIRTGIIGQVAGMDIYVTNNMFNYTNTATDRCYAILAGVNDFTSFAAQITEAETVTIPDSFGKNYRSLNVYGRKVLQSTAAALTLVTK